MNKLNKNVKKMIKNLTIEEWKEMVSMFPKKELRKLYRVSRTYITATCEAVGIITEDSKVSKTLKIWFKENFTYEDFLRIVNEYIPELIERSKSGEDIEAIVKEDTNRFFDRICEETGVNI